MELAFYKGNGNFYDTLIKVVTFSKYSHVELVINGTCYTSSPRDGGVRSKIIDLNSRNWDVFPVNGDEAYAFEFFEENMGKPYDWFGAIKSVLPLFPNHGNKFYCSEAVAIALKFKRHELTPEGLLSYARENNRLK